MKYSEPPKQQPEKSAFIDLSTHRFGPAHRSQKNPLIPYFQAAAVPGATEYIVNSFEAGIISLSSVLFAYRTFDGNWDEDAFGDGIVSTWSQQGKSSVTNDAPDLFSGTSNDGRPIRPVVFSGWNHFHVAESEVLDALTLSLFGVPYRWVAPNDPPTNAVSTTETNSFSKYLPLVESNNVVHTDEPGIADLRLLFTGNGNHSLLVRALNTWTTDSGTRQRTQTNTTDFVGHQIISSSNGGTITCVGTTGTKNQSQTPIGISGTNYWVVEGNEYLPASLSMEVDNGVVTNNVKTSTNNLSTATRMVTNCLVLLDSGAPQYQYGYFEGAVSNSITSGTNNYVAAQGFNLAGLLTPQAERAFDVPVDSATVVAILKKINQGEAISNGCHAPATPTRWQQTVSEWVTVNTNTGTFALNFFPITDPTGSYMIQDAWTDDIYSDWSYDSGTKTVTLNTPPEAPSQLIVTYEGFLGCAETFTNDYNGVDGVVSNLTTDTLAGIPIDASLLGVIRQKLEVIISLYKNTDVTSCSGTNWLLTNILASAASNYTGTWSPVSNNLVTAAHFTELSNVIAKLTVPYSRVTLNPASISAADTNPLPAGYQSLPYQTVITADGCTRPYALTVTSGSLPSGLILTNVTDTSAAITGTPTGILWPTLVVTNTFIITATDTNSCSTNQSYSIAIHNNLDSWLIGGWQASSVFPEDVYLPVNPAFATNSFSIWYCYNGLCGPDFDQAMGCYSCQSRDTAISNAVWALHHTWCSDPRSWYVDTGSGEIVMYCIDCTVPQDPAMGYSTNHVTDCDSLTTTVAAVLSNSCLWFSSNGTFSVTSPPGGMYNFWHGQTPTNISGCCTLGNSGYAANITWTSNGTSSATTPSTYPVILPCTPP